jgi:hypothetical protein
MFWNFVAIDGVIKNQLDVYLENYSSTNLHTFTTQKHRQLSMCPSRTCRLTNNNQKNMNISMKHSPLHNTGWRWETGKFEVDYEIPPRSQVPSARGFITLKRLVRLWNKKPSGRVLCVRIPENIDAVVRSPRHWGSDVGACKEYSITFNFILTSFRLFKNWNLMILYCAYNFQKTCWLKSKRMLTAKWTALN